jgi:hypothetical protein
MNIYDIIKEQATPDADVIAKFAGVSDSQRSYYIMKWAEEKGIDTDDAMIMAGYKQDGYLGAGAYNWRYLPPRNEADIDEAPVSTGKQRLRKIGAKVAGAFGAANKSAELKGRVEIGDEANALKIDFSNYLGKTGKKYKQVTGAYLAGFLRSEGYPTLHLKAFDQDIMSKAEIDKAIMVSAQKAGQPGATSEPSSGVTAQPKAQPKVPANISKAINTLSSKQKQQLASML